MKRAEIVVKGIVQGVGFRYFVRRAAIKHKLLGFVENLENENVRIICEGEKESIEKFISEIDIKGEPILIESIETKFSEAKREFESFKIITGTFEEEMVEGFSTGAVYLNIVRNEVKDVGFKVDNVANKVDNVANKVDNVGEKVDRTREELKNVIKEEHAKTRVELGSKIDNVADRAGELKTEHVKTREMSHEIFYGEVQELRRELGELRTMVEEIKRKVGIA